jgi:aspartate ammonia-lyase
MDRTRRETDGLGGIDVPADALWGAQTQRALANFPCSGSRLAPELVAAFGQVKAACARTNEALGFLDPALARPLLAACDELAASGLDAHIVVDPYQGGAGTSTHMNVNEVLANRANQLLGAPPGTYSPVHPLGHVNMHQSTNDTYPTALKVAALTLLKRLETSVAGLQEAFQDKERAFADILKVGRTQLQDGVPMTLGQEFGAWAEAMARDRWRVFKCRERLKTVNLGGTAVGTGLGAPRAYIFRVVDELRALTGLPLSRAENLVDATQNADGFVEVSGILKALAANLLKISSDLRLLASGPGAGLAEIALPAMQAGSTIMPGKVNPVIPECVGQVALRVMANDGCITLAAALGQLELVQYLPLLAHSLLESLRLLDQAARLLAERCVRGIDARPERCRELVASSPTVLAAAFVPALGYAAVERAVAEARRAGISLAEAIVRAGLLDREGVERILSPARTTKLGHEPDEFEARNRDGQDFLDGLDGM